MPDGAQLTGKEQKQIVDWVDRGGHLATADRELLEPLGIGESARVQIGGVTMRGLDGVASWAKPLEVSPLAGSKLVALASSSPGRRVVMAAKSSGKGMVIAFALDPVRGAYVGWELLPEAPTIVGKELVAPTGPTSQGAEIFVDPGGLSASLKANPTRIASLLARGGARVAEIAAWDYDFTDPANDYDYGALIRALHARGILAYAWIEPPFVTLRLWQDDPACREKTETGRDAVVSWRSLVALEDPACFTLATASWRRILDRYPWDGVDVAELYFEAQSEGAQNYTPFSKAALKEFGRDPRSHPKAFAAFRTALATRLNRELLEFVDGLPNARRLGVELTVIDDWLDPAFARSVGNDDAALASVARRVGASLVVEDPHTTWSDGPLRYDRLGPRLTSLMPPESALLDLNVVPRAGAHPTMQMTGAELALALNAASASLGRVAIYALGTLTPADLDAIPRALAGATSTTDLGVFGRWTVKVTAPSPQDGQLFVDGIPWPTAHGTALVPPGNHLLRWVKGPPVGPGLLAFTGQIGTARASPRAISFSYETHPVGLAVVTARPTSLAIDGSRARLQVVPSPGGGFVVQLPGGTHRAVLGF